MSRFPMFKLIVAVALGACSPSTSLSGSITCETMQCSSGEICRFEFAGVDAGPGTSASCVKIPDDCDVFDCYGATCSPCAASLCSGYNVPELAARITVMARTLTCPGQ